MAGTQAGGGAEEEGFSGWAGTPGGAQSQSLHGSRDPWVAECTLWGSSRAVPSSAGGHRAPHIHLTLKDTFTL